MAEKQYTAKQLRLTNEEIIEKFAIYGAEVDAVAQRQRASDRILETAMWKIWSLERRMKEQETSFEALCIILTLACIAALVILFV